MQDKLVMTLILQLSFIAKSAMLIPVSEQILKVR